MNYMEVTEASWVPKSLGLQQYEIVDSTLERVTGILRFPIIVQNNTRKLGEKKLQKFSGCFNFLYVGWGGSGGVYGESNIHYDSMENITLYYDNIPCAYCSFSSGSQYTVIQTLQGVGKNPVMLSEIDWELTLLNTVEQLARIYFPNTKMGIIDDTSHPFYDTMPAKRYDYLACRLGYMRREEIKRPSGLLYYSGEDIGIWLKNTD